MNLLAPLMLAGLLGLALPLIAHLLGREPPRRIRFAAVRFLSPTEQTVTHRRALHEVPLLIVRLLLLAVIVFALSRPVTSGPPSLAVVGEPHDAVLLVDVSGSMALRTGRRTVLSHAADRGLALLEVLPPGSRVGLTTNDPNGSRIDVGDDRERIRGALEELTDGARTPPGAWRLDEAVPVAAGLLTRVAEGGRKQVIYAIGDGTERGLGSLPGVAENGIAIIPIPALDEFEVPEHVGLEDVAWESAPELDPRAVRVQASVRLHAAPENGRPTATRAVAVALRVDEREVARTTVELQAGEATSVEFTHTLLGEDGPRAATIALVDEKNDPLPIDDRRDFWLSAEDALRVVIVNGEPSELRAHDEVFFLTTALLATDGQESLRVRSVAPDQLEEDLRRNGARALAEIDVLVLANVEAPEEDIAPLIVEAVRRGMGLWVTVGDRVEAAPYNARIGPVLPLPLREAVLVGTAPGRTEARVEGVAPADLSHPVFRDMTGDLGISGTRARKVFLLEPDPSQTSTIAISFTSGAPALITREVDAGRVALLTTAIDRDWSDLPLRPGFVALAERVISWLGRAREGPSGSTLFVGQSRSIRADRPLTVIDPLGTRSSVAPDRDGNAVFDDTFTLGHYRIERPEEDAARPTEAFAVQVDPGECDTRWTIDPTAIAADDNGELRRVATSVPRWRILVLLAVALLGIETFLRWARRRS